MRSPTIGHRVELIKEKFRHSLGLPFQKLLPEQLFEEALRAEGTRWRKRLFSPGGELLSNVVDGG